MQRFRQLLILLLNSLTLIFKLNEDRTGLDILSNDGPLADKVANIPDEMTKQEGVTIGQGFGVITDMQVGPEDGYLYILTLQGSLYRIVPSFSPVEVKISAARYL